MDPDVIIDDGDFGDFESGTFSLRVYLKKRNRYLMPVIWRKPTARTKKQRVQNVEDQKFRLQKSTKSQNHDYNLSQSF